MAANTVEELLVELQAGENAHTLMRMKQAWVAATNAAEARFASLNSSMPKCPAPVPCEDIMSNRVCGKVPKCFSRYGTSGIEQPMV